MGKRKEAPAVGVDWAEVERLASLRYVPAEIAVLLGVAVEDLDREARARGHPDFLTFWVKKALESGVLIREGLQRLARAGDLAALKFLEREREAEAHLAHLALAATQEKGGDVARKKALYVRLLRAGWLRGAAAREVGVDRTTIWRWRKADPEFDRACQEAEAAAVEAVEDALYRAALDGNVTAIQVILYNRAPERWADRRAQAAQPAPVVAASGPEAEARLAELIRAYLQRHGDGGAPDPRGAREGGS